MSGVEPKQVSQLSNPSLSDRLVLVLGPLLLWFILGSVTRSLTQLAATKTTTLALTLWSGLGLGKGACLLCQFVLRYKQAMGYTLGAKTFYAPIVINQNNYTI